MPGARLLVVEINRFQTEFAQGMQLASFGEAVMVRVLPQT
jgi:hypothetical protein